MTRKSASLQLKAIVEISKETQKEYDEIIENLVKRFHIDRVSLHRLIPDINVESGYANKTYRGMLPEALIDITPLELSMICDNGYSHFGGQSSINPNGSFTVKIYTD